MKALLVLFFWFAIEGSCVAQDIVLRKSEAFLLKQEDDKAGKILIEALKTDPTNLDYQAKLGFVYMRIRNDSSALGKQLLLKVLAKDSLQQLANLYLSILSYQEKQYRKAIQQGQRATATPNRTGTEDYFRAYYMIAYSYKRLLSLEGLTYTEVDRMLATMRLFAKSPLATYPRDVLKYIQYIESTRPDAFVEKWQKID
ncbi:hypothetical protein GCM10028822_18040 [Hymenobacter terrigena]